jgi:hypothetical protein
LLVQKKQFLHVFVAKKNATVVNTLGQNSVFQLRLLLSATKRYDEHAGLFWNLKGAKKIILPNPHII